MTIRNRSDAFIGAASALMRTLVVIVALLVTVIPFLYLFINSVKLPVDYLAVPPVIIPSQITWEHYQAMFSPRSHTLLYLQNSLLITGATTLISVVVGSLAAYSLAHLELPHRIVPAIGLAFLVVRFFPRVSLAIPFFVLMRGLGLIDTQLAVVIAHTSVFLPFVVWIMLGFFQELPKELEQSAMLDGCNPLQRFFHIALPLTLPALATAAILVAIGSWNEFLIAATLGPGRAKTLPNAVAGFITDKGILWGPMSAMSTIIVVPIMIFSLFAQRYLVRGLTLGAVKE
jgi:multiple sugar transport system permease protein